MFQRFVRTNEFAMDFVIYKNTKHLPKLLALKMATARFSETFTTLYVLRGIVPKFRVTH
jgi:hypothetical protein